MGNEEKKVLINEEDLDNVTGGVDLESLKAAFEIKNTVLSSDMTERANKLSNSIPSTNLSGGAKKLG